MVAGGAPAHPAVWWTTIGQLTLALVHVSHCVKLHTVVGSNRNHTEIKYSIGLCVRLFLIETNTGSGPTPLQITDSSC